MAGARLLTPQGVQTVKTPRTPAEVQAEIQRLNESVRLGEMLPPIPFTAVPPTPPPVVQLAPVEEDTQTRDILSAIAGIAPLIFGGPQFAAMATGPALGAVGSAIDAKFENEYERALRQQQMAQRLASGTYENEMRTFQTLADVNRYQNENINAANRNTTALYESDVRGVGVQAEGIRKAATSGMQEDTRSVKAAVKNLYDLARDPRTNPEDGQRYIQEAEAMLNRVAGDYGLATKQEVEIGLLAEMSPYERGQLEAKKQFYDLTARLGELNRDAQLKIATLQAQTDLNLESMRQWGQNTRDARNNYVQMLGIAATHDNNIANLNLEQFKARFNNPQINELQKAKYQRLVKEHAAAAAAVDKLETEHGKIMQDRSVMIPRRGLFGGLFGPEKIEAREPVKSYLENLKKRIGDHSAEVVKKATEIKAMEMGFNPQFGATGTSQFEAMTKFAPSVFGPGAYSNLPSTISGAAATLSTTPPGAPPSGYNVSPPEIAPSGRRVTPAEQTPRAPSAPGVLPGQVPVLLPSDNNYVPGRRGSFYPKTPIIPGNGRPTLRNAPPPASAQPVQTPGPKPPNASSKARSVPVIGAGIVDKHAGRWNTEVKKTAPGAVTAKPRDMSKPGKGVNKLPPPSGATRPKSKGLGASIIDKHDKIWSR